jgi:hypothetical protein
VRDRKKRQLTKAELRAMGATPGLMAHKVGPDGRARLEQLAPEGPERRRDFIRRLTNQDDVNEASEGSK